MQKDIHLPYTRLRIGRFLFLLISIMLMFTLRPFLEGFVGIGVFIMHLLEGNFRKAVSEGGNTILNSAVLFLIFGSFFRAIFDQDPFLGDYWPLLLIFAGLWMLVRPFLRRRTPVEVEAEVEVIEEA